MKKIVLFFLVLLASNAVAWELITNKDDFRGTVSYFIVSDRVKPNSPLDFPYNNPEVRLIFNCEDKNFFLINTANNLQGEDIKDGYSIHNVDVKMDGGFYTLDLLQKWHTDYFFLMGHNSTKVLNYATREFVIQLDHYSDGLRHYIFDMTSFDKNECPII